MHKRLAALVLAAVAAFTLQMPARATASDVDLDTQLGCFGLLNHKICCCILANCHKFRTLQFNVHQLLTQLLFFLFMISGTRELRQLLSDTGLLLDELVERLVCIGDR